MLPKQTRILPGEQFGKEVILDADVIAHFAELVCDTNPVHRDNAAAKALGFNQIIASGPHTSAILTALLADHYSRVAPMLGLEFSVKFLQPIFAEKRCRYEWLVVSVENKPSLLGELVSLTGCVMQDEKMAISATAVVAVMFDKLKSEIQPEKNR